MINLQNLLERSELFAFCFRYNLELSSIRSKSIHLLDNRVTAKRKYKGNEYKARVYYVIASSGAIRRCIAPHDTSIGATQGVLNKGRGNNKFKQFPSFRELLKWLGPVVSEYRYKRKDYNGNSKA
jgi:hypothetical protein